MPGFSPHHTVHVLLKGRIRRHSCWAGRGFFILSCWVVGTHTDLSLFVITGILQALRQKRPLRRGEAVVEKAEGAVFVLCSSFSFPNGGASSPADGWRGGWVRLPKYEGARQRSMQVVCQSLSLSFSLSFSCSQSCGLVARGTSAHSLVVLLSQIPLRRRRAVPPLLHLGPLPLLSRARDIRPPPWPLSPSSASSSSPPSAAPSPVRCPQSSSRRRRRPIPEPWLLRTWGGTETLRPFRI